MRALGQRRDTQTAHIGYWRYCPNAMVFSVESRLRVAGIAPLGPERSDDGVKRLSFFPPPRLKRPRRSIAHDPTEPKSTRKRGEKTLEMLKWCKRKKGGKSTVYPLTRRNRAIQTLFSQGPFPTRGEMFANKSRALARFHCTILALVLPPPPPLPLFSPLGCLFFDSSCSTCPRHSATQRRPASRSGLNRNLFLVGIKSLPTIPKFCVCGLGTTARGRTRAIVHAFTFSFKWGSVSAAFRPQSVRPGMTVSWVCFRLPYFLWPRRSDRVFFFFAIVRFYGQNTDRSSKSEKEEQE